MINPTLTLTPNPNPNPNPNPCRVNRKTHMTNETHKDKGKSGKTTTTRQHRQGKRHDQIRTGQGQGNKSTF